jgi:hypothetical protein
MLTYTPDPDSPAIPNSTLLMSNSQDIMKVTRELDRIAELLEAVGMLPLAKRVAYAASAIYDLAEPMSDAVIAWQRNEMGHNEHIMGGLLQLVMTKDIVDKKVST